MSEASHRNESVSEANHANESVSEASHGNGSVSEANHANESVSEASREAERHRLVFCHIVTFSDVSLVQFADCSIDVILKALLHTVVTRLP